ncbi:mitotic spindle checkpoint component mad2 [Backusella circina FSU 941]|nr:mitotic spindle checkpoint component mad2 [Backusella circina FSU 941]
MDSKSPITLHGSAEFVVQFFECCLHSILFHRGIYPADDFKVTKKYGMNVIITVNDELKEYIRKIFEQLEVWAKEGSICKLVVVIKEVETMEVVERWHFDIHIDEESGVPMIENIPPADATRIQKSAEAEIRTVLRQIVSSVSYLPELTKDCTFNVLVYANEDVEVPSNWGDSEPNLIKGGGEHVRLKSFSTLVHTVDTFVAYRLDEDE